MAHAPDAPDAPLLFDWPRREGFPWFLFTFVVFSLAAHVASFFLFRVLYPQRATLPQRAPQIILLTPSSPENEAFLRWIDAADPALVAAAGSVTPPGLLDVPYRPSYATLRTPPRGIAEPASSIQFPPAKDPLAIVRSVEAGETVTPRIVPRLMTSVSISGPLAAREFTHPPDLTGVANVSAPVEPMRFLVGVTDRGEVRFIYPQEIGSDPGRNGDVAALETQAAERLARSRFAPGGDPVTWGFATIAWGDDVYTTGSQP